MQRKAKASSLFRETILLEITEKEFHHLKAFTLERRIIRDGYYLSEGLRISIKIYHEDYEGLIRAEVEFPSIEEVQNFTPLSWMGNEITNTLLGKDSELIKLTTEEFKKLLVHLTLFNTFTTL